LQETLKLNKYVVPQDNSSRSWGQRIAQNPFPATYPQALIDLLENQGLDLEVNR
jgi:hypothetical protein